MSINDAKNQIKLFTVDGPIPVTGGGSPGTEYAEGSAHTSASGPATMCVVDTSTPSLTDETYTTLRTDAAGNVKTVAIVSGTVAVGNFPVTQPVSGTVSVGNFPATQPVSGTVAVSNFPTAAALSDTTVNPTTAMTGAALMVYDAVSARWVRAISGHGPVTTGVQRIAPAEAVTYIASTGLFTPAIPRTRYFSRYSAAPRKRCAYTASFSFLARHPEAELCPKRCCAPPENVPRLLRAALR